MHFYTCITLVNHVIFGIARVTLYTRVNVIGTQTICNFRICLWKGATAEHSQVGSHIIVP